MATSAKLNKILETKAAIKQAIIDKGVDVGEDVVFADYPSKISAIESGSGGPDYTSFYLATTNNNTTYYELFQNCKLDSIDLSNLDTSNIIDMSYMFSGCNELTTLDISNFNTGNVTNMNNMFYRCNKLISIEGLSSFNTNNVIKMASMFYSCYEIISIDLNSFDTGNVTDMSYMFSGCNKLTTLDLSNFDMTNVTNTTSMFINCWQLHTLRLDNCSNDTINKIITSSNFNTGTITGVTRKIYCKEANVAGLTAPTNWAFEYVE